MGYREFLVLITTILSFPAGSAGQGQATGSMSDNRLGHTMTLLPSGKVLAAGGFEGEQLNSAELYDPATGTWEVTGFMTAPRNAHTATLLTTGKVLVVGGLFENNVLAGAELYDPATGLWEDAAPLHTGRILHTATLLPSGQVLVVGGNTNQALSSVELYDPELDTWTEVTSLNDARTEHTATLLPSGQVLVASGVGSDFLTSAELYDPGADTWTSTTDPITLGRRGHSAVLLASGEVLLIGGSRVTNLGNPEPDLDLTSVEIYDPMTDTWSDAADLGTARRDTTVALLPSGRVFVAGGVQTTSMGEQYLASVEIYDPLADTWLSAPDLRSARTQAVATLLFSGDVLVSGGRNLSFLASTEIFHPETAFWVPGNPLATPRSDHAAARLPDGRALVAGGDAGVGMTEIYDPATGTWEPAGAMSTPRRLASATLLTSGQVLVAAGASGNTALDAAELFDPLTGEWQPTESLTHARVFHTAVRLLNGEVLVAGGFVAGPGDIAQAEIYNPDPPSWRPAGTLLTPRRFASSAVLPSGEVLLIGGFNGSALSSVEIYDPRDGSWRFGNRLVTSRRFHTTTVLPSGEVLIAGGFDSGADMASADLYDPVSGRWRRTGSLQGARRLHRAVLLPSGKVLVAGGLVGDPGTAIDSAEIYDRASETWTTIPPLAAARHLQSMTLLPSGEVLVAGGLDGGALASTEVFVPDTYSARPVIDSVSILRYNGDPWTVSGSGFYAPSEASSGSTSSSAVQQPLVRLRALEGGRLTWLVPDPRAGLLPDPVTGSWEDPTTLTVDAPPPLPPGHYQVTVLSAGTPSVASPFEVLCEVSLATEPSDRTVALGESAELTVVTRGARFFQWLKDGIPIPGATGPTYTTPPITAADSGARYQVVASSDCTSVPSRTAVVTVEDFEPPAVDVLTPDGGEFWPLSTAERPQSRLVTWSMSDNVRVCRVDVALQFSDDGGSTWTTAPAGGGLPFTDGGGGVCDHPGIQTTSAGYDLPETPPSGRPGSLYRIRVTATDQAGNQDPVTSDHPFFIVPSVDPSVKTLILTHIARMQDPEVMGVSSSEAAELRRKLTELADHPLVQGLVIDLGGNAEIDPLYQAWDTDRATATPMEPPEPRLANNVLFGCPDPLPLGCAPPDLGRKGIHGVLRDLLDIYTGTEYLILAGDDRILPFARVTDRTVLFAEGHYADADPLGDLDAGLRALGTAVGESIEAGFYLSDDPVAVRGAVHPDDLLSAEALFLPELAVGRLVETPQEIGAAIDVFLRQEGELDLTALDPAAGHKVQVTGYDFLVDSGKKIRERWRTALGAAGDETTELAPVDGVLLSSDWGIGGPDPVPLRRQSLSAHLQGNGGDAYGVVNLNGHATHFEEGVPGQGVQDIQGLAALDIYGGDTCGGIPDLVPPPDLLGSVIYAVGCHGGLSVPGSCASDADRSLDLPQTLLRRGAAVYVANTGYGWGLRHGIGLSERLVEIFTEEMTAGGTVTVGEIFTRSKERYFLEAPRLDAYDLKTSMQWVFYGFPMYAVTTGLPASAGRALPSLSESLRSGSLGGVGIEQRQTGKAAPQPFLIRLDLRFDFMADGLFRKWNADGDPVTVAGCDDPDGCYYTLNNLVERATDESDLPLQPFFVFDSRLAATSQHGVLWKGGTYEEEGGWIPLIGELQSNGGDASSHARTPRKVYSRPRGARGRRGRLNDEANDCRPSDAEINSVVVTTGEAVALAEGGPLVLERLHKQIDLEVLYFNDTRDPDANCDREGPVFEGVPESYAVAVGTTVEWTVEVSDAGGDPGAADRVWRVLVVHDDELADRWVPLELERGADGRWRGQVTTPLPSLTYFLQAVDVRGNVSWLEFVEEDGSSSGIPLGVPRPLEVPISTTSAIFEDGFESGDMLRWW